VRVLSKADIRTDDVLKTFTNAHLMLSAFSNMAATLNTADVGADLLYLALNPRMNYNIRVNIS